MDVQKCIGDYDIVWDKGHRKKIADITCALLQEYSVSSTMHDRVNHGVTEWKDGMENVYG